MLNKDFKRRLFGFILLSLLVGLEGYGQKSSQNVRLFYLGGQSNMRGFGYNKELPDHLQKPIEGVYIFQGNPVPDNEENGGLGLWETLRPGHGTYFESDGNSNKLSERFGVELSFAKKLKDLYPNDRIAIIKYARNGSSLDSASAREWGSWEVDYRVGKGINQFDHFLATVRNAYADTDIDNDGIKDSLMPSGIIWMQGESDSYQESAALLYYDNLRKLMNLIRSSFRLDDLPVVIGKISDSGDNAEGKVWKYGELVQYAQEKYALENSNVAIVRSTRNYDYTDQFHYTSAGYLDLGEKFAESLYKLMQVDN